MPNSSTTTNKRVLVGFSGGVDSTAAVLFLRDAGYEVGALFIDVLGAEADSVRLNAAALADQMKLPFHSVNVAERFKQQVIEPFCKDYLLGRTPNPCVICNPLIKFRVLSEQADLYDYPWIATGHYARIDRPNQPGMGFGEETMPDVGHETATVDYLERTVDCSIRQAYCLPKDQSYMLYRLEQTLLRRLLLPLGEVASKQAVREKVRRTGLLNADQRDSQEICFVDEAQRIELIESFNRESGEGRLKKEEVYQAGDFGDQLGNFVDQAGNILGRHGGIARYTIGQRKNLGISLGRPMYVTKINAQTNTVVLGDDSDLFYSSITVEDVVFTKKDDADLAGTAGTPGPTVFVKIRSAAKAAPARLCDWQAEQRLLTINFEEAQRAPAPGQSAVFYIGDRLIGGGIINS